MSTQVTAAGTDPDSHAVLCQSSRRVRSCLPCARSLFFLFIDMNGFLGIVAHVI